MSNFDRTNYSYRSLPINNNHQYTTTTSARRYQPINSSNTNVNNSIKKFENSEEFARLDELLADLLSEVEQPILLNKNGSVINWKLNTNNNNNHERSVDYLKDQKDRLRHTNSIKEEDGPEAIAGFKVQPTLSSSSSSYRNRNDYYHKKVPQMGTYSYLNSSLNDTHKPPLSPRYNNNLPQRPNTSCAIMLSGNNEDDDDRCSIKSGLSTTSTILRSKYHTISNNFVEQTKAQPTLSASSHSLKRAVSAPPTEPGKILLQRMELKSPLTVRYPLESRSQVDPNESRSNTLRPILNNKYNNRGILKTNTLQPQPQRVFTRANSERPAKTNHNTTNGYDTDTCLSTNRVNGTTRLDNFVDSDGDSIRVPGNRRYYHDGYETDSGTHRRKLPIQPPTVFNNTINTSFHHNQQQQQPNKCYDSFTLPIQQQNGHDLSQNNSAFQTIKDTQSRATPTNSFNQKQISSSYSNNFSPHDNNNNSLLVTTVNKPTLSQQSQPQQDIYNKFNTTTRVDTRSPSVSSINEVSDINGNTKLVKNSQSYWYKPKISREEAINILKDKQPGAFIIRDSNNFPGSFGLALKVDKLPPNVPVRPNVDHNVELVRHFLIEPTNKGVRIKGCCNEPVFGSLAALVYQHSITPLALPCKLVIPTRDLTAHYESTKTTSLTPTPSTKKINQGSDPNYARQLLEKGAACNVYYLNSLNVGSLQGNQAISKALSCTKSYEDKDISQLLLVQFKVNSQGVFVSDLSKKKFSRKQFPTNTVMFAGIEEKRCWPLRIDKIANPKIFGVVCRPKITSGDNECHLFIEVDPEQPAIAIIDFINRYLIPSKLNQQQQQHLSSKSLAK